MTGESWPAARRGPQLFLNSTFGPFFAGKVLWAAGIWVFNVSAAILVFQLTRSTLLVGMVSVAQFFPQLALAPWSGARADRSDRQHQANFGVLVSASGAIALVLWIFTIGLQGTSGAVAVIAAGSLAGIGQALGGPAMHALLPALVRPSELPTAVALNSLPFTIGRVGGPAVGALLVTRAGPEMAFGITAATGILFGIIISTIRIRVVERPVTRGRSVRAALGHLRADPAIAFLLLGIVTVGIGADPAITLTPAIAHMLGYESALVGALLSSFGAGAGIAFLTLSWARHRLGLARLGASGLSILAIGLGALAFSPNAGTAFASMACGGAGMTFALTSLTTLIQQRVPEELRGRVMALWSVAFLGSRPFAAALNGAIADALSVRAALLVVMALIVVGAMVVRPSRIS